jgi:endonuclease/exonuclease/phosphatase family metal-dependent hydrolase
VRCSEVDCSCEPTIAMVGEEVPVNNPSTSLRIATCNIRYGTADDGVDSWGFRRHVLIDTLRVIDADILGTQEGLPFQLDELDAAFPRYGRCGLGRYHGVAVDRPHEAYSGEHCAVFYRRPRFELVSTDTSWLSDTPEVPGSCCTGAHLARVVTRAIFREPSTDRTLTVLNTHYHWGTEVTATSTLRLTELLDMAPATHAIIVTGDFNLDPDSPEHESLLGFSLSGDRRLVDAWDRARAVGCVTSSPVGTTHGFTGTPDRRIDWILVSDEVQVTGAVIDHSNKRGRYPSDHFPFVVDVELPL